MLLHPSWQEAAQAMQQVQLNAFGVANDKSADLNQPNGTRTRRPRVYIYEHPELVAFLQRLDSREMREWAFGAPLGTTGYGRGWWSTDTFNLGAIVLYRLLKSGYGAGGSRLTDNPAEADLFFIALLPDGPPYREDTVDEVSASRLSPP